MTTLTPLDYKVAAWATEELIRRGKTPEPAPGFVADPTKQEAKTWMRKAIEQTGPNSQALEQAARRYFGIDTNPHTEGYFLGFIAQQVVAEQDETI